MANGDDVTLAPFTTFPEIQRKRKQRELEEYGKMLGFKREESALEAQQSQNLFERMVRPLRFERERAQTEESVRGMPYRLGEKETEVHKAEAKRNELSKFFGGGSDYLSSDLHTPDEIGRYKQTKSQTTARTARAITDYMNTGIISDPEAFGQVDAHTRYLLQAAREERKSRAAGTRASEAEAGRDWRAQLREGGRQEGRESREYQSQQNRESRERIAGWQIDARQKIAELRQTTPRAPNANNVYNYVKALRGIVSTGIGLSKASPQARDELYPYLSKAMMALDNAEVAARNQNPMQGWQHIQQAEDAIGRGVTTTTEYQARIEQDINPATGQPQFTPVGPGGQVPAPMPFGGYPIRRPTQGWVAPGYELTPKAPLSGAQAREIKMQNLQGWLDKAYSTYADPNLDDTQKSRALRALLFQATNGGERTLYVQAHKGPMPEAEALFTGLSALRPILGAVRPPASRAFQREAQTAEENYNAFNERMRQEMMKQGLGGEMEPARNPSQINKPLPPQAPAPTGIMAAPYPPPGRPVPPKRPQTRQDLLKYGDHFNPVPVYALGEIGNRSLVNEAKEQGKFTALAALRAGQSPQEASGLGNIKMRDFLKAGGYDYQGEAVNLGAYEAWLKEQKKGRKGGVTAAERANTFAPPVAK